MTLPEVIIVGKASDFIKFNYFVMADFTTTERTTEHYVSHNTTTDSNSTEERMWESAIPPAMQFVFGVIGNIIALVVLVMSSKTHKWRPFYRLVAGLAVTDGGGILLVYPTVMVRYATDFTYLFPKALCNYSSFVYTFTLISSAMIVCAMSLDRYVAILHPFLYGSGKNGRRANVTLCIVWTAGAVISGLQLVGLGSSFNYYPKSWCFINFVEMNTLDRVNSYIYSITGILLLLVTLGVNITVIVSVLRNMKSGIKSSKRRQKNDIFIISFLLVIVLIFSSCWAPLMVVIFAHACRMMITNGSLELLVLRLAVTNSIIDPWIYILLRKETIVGLLRVKTAISGLCFTKKDQPSPKTGAAEETRSKYTAKESRDASTSPEIIVKFTCPHSQVYDGSEGTDPDRPGIDNPAFFKDDSKTEEIEET